MTTNEHFGLAIDPGLSTGACLFSWSDDQGFRLLWTEQFGGGVEGVVAWLRFMNFRVDADRGVMVGSLPISALVVEKFTPRASQNFSLTRASVEPLRVEGALVAFGMSPYIHWAEPSQQYFIGSASASLGDKKRASRQFLKQHDINVRAKKLSQGAATLVESSVFVNTSTDVDDATSATLHAIAWLRRQRHMPTLRELFPPTS